MESLLQNTKVLIVILALAVLAVIFLAVRLFYVPHPNSNAQFYTKSGPNVDVVPTVAPDANGLNAGGFDSNSEIAKESQRNIDLFRKSLPFQESFKSSSGINVKVLVPKDQANPLELEVYVTGVNFSAVKEESDYNTSRTAFLEAADKVFAWMKPTGADPTKIYISWGPKKVMRDKAREWLDSR